MKQCLPTHDTQVPPCYVVRSNLPIDQPSGITHQRGHFKVVLSLRQVKARQKSTQLVRPGLDLSQERGLNNRP
jgi:hypothetical protein